MRLKIRQNLGLNPQHQQIALTETGLLISHHLEEEVGLWRLIDSNFRHRTSTKIACLEKLKILRAQRYLHQDR